MDIRLSKCARCDKLYNRILSEVCMLCQPDEDQDFVRIRDVLGRAKGMNAQQVAEEAGVTVDCVIRMLREGRIDNVAHDAEATCGRCGAPAISNVKRLCNRCLVELDRECAHAMHEMRARLMAKGSSDMNDVQVAVENRQMSRREKRKAVDRPVVPPPAPRPSRRMVMPQHLRRKTGGKS